MSNPAPQADLQAALQSIQTLAEQPSIPGKSVPAAASVEEPHRAEPLPLTNGELLRRIMNGGELDDCIPETMRESYVRALLGGAPFVHTFSVFDGKVEVTFKEPSADKALLHGRLAARLSPSDVEGMNALTMLYFLHKVSFPGSDREVVIFTPPDIPKSVESLPVEDLSIELQNTFIQAAGGLGGSLIRMLSSLWIMFSGAWRHLIQTSLPRTF